MATKYGYPEYVHFAGYSRTGHLTAIHSHDLLWQEVEKDNRGKVLPVGTEQVLKRRQPVRFLGE